MQNILQTHDEKKFGLYVRVINGLNIFSANGYGVSPSDDPRMAFLKTLSVQNSCSIHVGGVSLSDIVDEPEELFGQPSDESFYSRVKIGISEGIFYEGGDNNCFFPIASEQFWSTKDFDNTRNPVQYLIESGALALYANACDDVQTMTSLVSSHFPALQAPLRPSQSEWLQAVASIYRLIVVTGHDGMDFLVYTREASNFDVLSVPLQSATIVIEASQWYKQHQKVLMWDNQYEKCLMLPDALATLLNR